MRVIHLLRKPLSEGTVAANTLTHGVGGLNINTSRVGTEQVFTHSRGSSQAFPKRPGETSVEESGRKARQDILDHTPRTGRWPGNLILQHLPECECRGTRKVKGHQGYPNGPGGKSDPMHGWGGKRSAEVRPNAWSSPATDSEGRETIAVWECVEGCPVSALDDQSGILKSGAMDSIAKADQYTTYGKMYERRVTNPASEGGASRFFKQIGGSKEGD